MVSEAAEPISQKLANAVPRSSGVSAFYLSPRNWHLAALRPTCRGEVSEERYRPSKLQ